MFIPIGDENPRERTPYVNYALLAINIAAFFLFCFPTPDPSVLARYALTPNRMDWHTFLTSMFLHANLLHLVGNMLFLWIFGDNVEDRLGHAGYTLFYVVCGLAAAFLHLVTTPAQAVATAFGESVSLREIPMLGASGAISGVIGAYVVYFPRHRVKMLLWLYWYVDILLIPAFWWIGIWFLEQVLFSRLGFGGVAYTAHIGGFIAGVAIGGAARLGSAALAKNPLSPERREPPQTGESRRPFVGVEDDPGIEFLDESEDRYAVVRLAEELQGVGRIAETASAITGQDPGEVAHRLEATRGVILRGVPRATAERVQRELQAQKLAAAIILDNRANHPPRPDPVDAASWDDRLLRLRVRDRIVPVPWSASFLYMAARVDGEELIDVFLNRRSAFRVRAGQEVSLTRVDPLRRIEIATDLRGLARTILELGSGAAVNEGVRVLAQHGTWGWLAFRSPADYDDYVFWIYNLTLSQVPIHRG